MPDDIKPAGSAALDKAQEVGEQVLKELGIEGRSPTESIPAGQMEAEFYARMDKLMDEFEAAVKTGDLTGAGSAGDSVQASLKAQREDINVRIRAAESGMAQNQEWTKGYQKAEEELRSWQEAAARLETFTEETERYLDDTLGPLLATPSPAATEQPVPVSAVTEERMAQEDEQRAAGEGMTGIAAPEVRPAPETRPRTPEQIFHDTMMQIDVAAKDFEEFASKVVREAAVDVRKAELDKAIATPST